MTNEQGLPTRPFLGLSGLFPGRLVLLVVAAAVLGLALMLTAGSIAFAEDATSTSFAPNSVTLENIGDKATITLATEGADPIVSGVQVRIMHPDTLAVSGVRCTGIFDGGFSTESPQSGGGTLVGCARLSGSITSPTGDMMTFELERVGPFTAAQTVTIAPLGGPDSTFFSSEGQTVGGPGTTNELIVSPGEIPPVANAGEDQEVAVGATVTLDGSGSTGAATYRWTLTTVPESSNATASLTGADTAMASFVADLAGTYEAQLVVNDGTEDSAPDSVSIVATDVIENTPPVAAAGEDQDVATGDTVTLDGSGSADADGDSLTYAWSLITMPEGSTASLTGAATASPSFVADLAGTYRARLVVNDGTEDSAPDPVSIVATDVIENTPPVAAAGEDQTVATGDTVTLDGSGSADADGDSLTYAWSLITMPEGSTASLTGAATASPSFVADLAGTYEAQLVVNDGIEDSAPDTVSIEANSAPVSAAGDDQTVEVGDTVTLDGSGSADADGDSLTYAWSLITMPAGSTASLTGAATASPSFVADLAGTYQAQLVVNDGTEDSAADTVSIVAFDLVVGLPNPGQFTVLSAPTLLSQVPILDQEDPEGDSLIMIYANNEFIIFGEPGFDEEIVKPVTAFYITASSNATVGFNFAEITGPRQTSRNLDSAWNLIGTNFPGPAQDELSQIQNTVTTAGVVTLHVPNAHNSNKSSGHEDWESDGDRDLNANPITELPDRNLSELDGYWVFLNSPRTYSKILTLTETHLN